MRFAIIRNKDGNYLGREVEEYTNPTYGDVSIDCTFRFFCSVCFNQEDTYADHDTASLVIFESKEKAEEFLDLETRTIYSAFNDCEVVLVGEL